MQLYVQTLTGEKLTLQAASSDLVESMKSEIEAMKGIPTAQQRLIFGGKQADNVDEWREGDHAEMWHQLPPRFAHDARPCPGHGCDAVLPLGHDLVLAARRRRVGRALALRNRRPLRAVRHRVAIVKRGAGTVLVPRPPDQGPAHEAAAVVPARRRHRARRAR